MKKVFAMTLVVLIVFGLAGCALSELFNDKENLVELGNKDETVRWTLVKNDNEYRPVDSAYFDFTNDSFKYYENGELKKEGSTRITYFGLDNSNAPLHVNLNFGKDASGLSIFDYIDCYTEDAKDNLHQFTIVSVGYHINPKRAGGVPVRDYHLSEMPYALGTYLKEGSTYCAYANGKVNYLDASKLSGKFVDEKGNVLYLLNNSYSAKYQSSDYSKYTVYMRYENNTNDTFVEGTIKLSYYDDGDTNERRNVALIYVMHGEDEPGDEKGTSESPDYSLSDFTIDENSISFSGGTYFYDNQECDYDPTNFIGGTYIKINS